MPFFGEIGGQHRHTCSP